MATVISKLEAAGRQLDTAIRLFFSGGDAVSVHALAVAAANVFADVTEHQNAGISWRARMRDDAGLSMKELKAVMHEEWNFFKHADRDPNATLNFNDQLSEDFMFMAILDCGDLQSTSCPMQAFQIWYIAAHPERFPAAEPIFAEAMKVFPGLTELNRLQRIKLGAVFLGEHCTEFDTNSTKFALHPA